jgi:hypothetical protein
MVRFVVGFAAWTAGTVIAVCVAWLGANVVVRNAGVEPGMPVLNAAVLPATATSLPAATPSPAVLPSAGVPSAGIPSAASTGNASTGGTSPGHAAAGGAPRTAEGPGPSPSASAPASPSAGDVRAYPLVGGNVTLEVTDAAVQLVTAVPSPGYSVQTWSGTGWLRVDFSSGPQVSSLIASWYQHAPTITVTN